MNIAMQIVAREVGHGGMIPRGWQMAWYEPRRRVGVYYPSPLHWMLRAMREIASIACAWRCARRNRMRASFRDAAHASRSPAPGRRIRARIPGRLARMLSRVPRGG